MISFFFAFLLFEGINWCFVSYSFVSVKGPGRKLSLPTDLKTDLGTVGESQQFPLDFLSVINFLPLSHFRDFYVAFFPFKVLLFFTLKPSSFDFLVTLVPTILKLLFYLLTFFVIYLVFMVPLHFASVYKGDLLIAHN